ADCASDRASDRAADQGAAVGAALLVGLVAFPVVVAAAVVWAEARRPLAVLAVGLPLLLVQDALRHVAIARHQPRLAAVGDGLCLATLLVGAAAVTAGHATSPSA